MARCPIFIHALITAAHNHDPIWVVNDPSKDRSSIDCIKLRCQMWDAKRKDCGLKRPAEEAKKTKEKLVLPPPSPNSLHEI